MRENTQPDSGWFPTQMNPVAAQIWVSKSGTCNSYGGRNTVFLLTLEANWSHSDISPCSCSDSP